MKLYICRMTISDGVICLGHTTAGRARRLVDLWHRLRFFAYELRNQMRVNPSPFRFIRSARAALTMASTFDRNIRQAKASSSGPTNSVGNDGDSSGSPLSGVTITRCCLPQSGQRIDESSSVSDRHNLSI